jgi:ferritin-like protein
MCALLSRAALLATGARRGAALLVAGTAFGALADTAAADPLSDSDLAFARLLTGAELLSIDFYLRALNANLFRAAGRKYLNNTFLNEIEHYRSVSAILSGAGYTPAGAEDFQFSYPAGSFSSRVSIARLGRDLETIFLGSYLGAVAAVQTQALIQPLARIAASEAQHLSLWGFELGGHPVSAAFPAPYTIDQASAAMDQYAS